MNLASNRLANIGRSLFLGCSRQINLRSFDQRRLLLKHQCRSFAATASGERKVNVNVGTIGHIDHGKTTLTAAITHVLAKRGLAKPIKFDEIDKGKEEKKRGITINIAHIGYESAGRRYSHTDCPGHADFIKNMICGTSQMDAAVLVIAATDGVMAQTKEHLILARQIGLKNIIVFINKADLVEEDVLDLVEIEARELLSLHGFDGDNANVIRGSALEALEGKDTSCVDNLISALDSVPEPPRSENEAFCMPVASKVAITGRGTVVVGTVERGVLKKGEKVEIKGDGGSINATASDIQVFSKSVKEVRAGDHCGILCRGVKQDDVRRGMWMGHVGAITATNHVKAEIYLLSEEENGRKTGIRTGFTDKMFCSTWDQVGRFELEQEMLMPGEHTTATILLIKDMPLRQGMPFTLREGKSKQTLARGVISELLPTMARKAEDDLEDYVWGRVKEKEYLQRIINAENKEIESILRRVSQIDDTLNRQLRKGVEENLSRLLEQTTALEALDKTQRGVHDEMSDVFQNCDKFARDLDELLIQYNEQTQKMEHLVKVKNLLVDAMRCEDLMDSLDKRSELVKRSEIVCELCGIIQDSPELSQLVWLKDTIENRLKIAENEIRKAAADDLKRGLVSLNASLVGTAIKALSNLQVLEAELEAQLASSASEVDGKLAELSSSPDPSRLLPICMNSIHSHLEQCSLLGPAYLSLFCEKLARSIKARIHLDCNFRLRFVQQMGRLLHSRPECSLGPLNDALRPLKTSILSQSLQKLYSLIESHDFSAGHANAFVEMLSSAFEEELSKVDFDVELKAEVQKNIKKSIEMVSKRLEMETKLGSENLLFGDRLTTSQLTNYRLLQSATALASRWPNHAHSLISYQEDVLSTVLESMKKGVTSILLSLHKEPLGNKDISPYMQELCDYLRRILLHCSHMGAAVQQSVTLHNMADFVMESFLLFATLVRPIDHTVRRQLHADFQSLLSITSEFGQGSRFPDLPSLGTLFTAELPHIPSQVPLWAAAHVLICASPTALVSPQQSVNWTVEEYVSWCLDHSDLERITFINTLLTSYAASVVSKGELEYVPFYPHLSQIINQLLQS